MNKVLHDEGIIIIIVVKVPVLGLVKYGNIGTLRYLSKQGMISPEVATINPCLLYPLITLTRTVLAIPYDHWTT